MGDPVAELRAAVEGAAATLRGGDQDGTAAPVLERPPKPEFGDYSTNAAMLLAPALGEQPRGTADRLAEELQQSLKDSLEKVEVAGPGFLNLFLSDAWYRRAAAELAAAGDDLGRQGTKDERINVEFVSANPTGPLHAGGGRWVAVGDALANLLATQGADLIKVEADAKTVRTIVHNGIAVWAQLGNEAGDFVRQARLLEDAGASLLDFRHSGPVAGPAVTKAVSIPVIGGLGRRRKT